MGASFQAVDFGGEGGWRRMSPIYFLLTIQSFSTKQGKSILPL